MGATDLRAVYRDYLDCLNRRHWEQLPRFVHDDVVHNGKRLGADGYRALLESDTRAVPDLRYHPQLVLVDGALLACLLRFDCTPVQPFLGFPPTGNPVSFAGHVFYRFDAGRIAEVWSLIDRDAVGRQLSGSVQDD